MIPTYTAHCVDDIVKQLQEVEELPAVSRLKWAEANPIWLLNATRVMISHYEKEEEEYAG
jgi:hypothetical protein